MVAERLEVRLDPERRRRLAVIAAGQGKPASEVVRQMIDRAYQEDLREQRMRAALELGQLEVEEVPDPEVLSRQLDDAYELPDLY